MALTLITGTAGTDATPLVLERLRSAAASGHSARLLLPSARDVSRAISVLATGDAFGVSTSTFDDYLDALWLGVGDGRQIVSPVQRIVMLAEAGRIWKPRILSDSGQGPGMMRVLSVVVQRAAETVGQADGSVTGAGAGGELLEFARLYAKGLG
ncbi:MAG: hypothetical protein EG823_09320, partial [Actinobacteria bacterium]|nr:hypothetical protein [Actinomycetota bacterium]